MKKDNSQIEFNPEQELENIATLGEQNGLVLFLGAGVTADNVLTWNDLLDELLKRALQVRSESNGVGGLDVQDIETLAESKDITPERKATLVKRLFGKSYLSQLRHYLYNGKKDDERYKSSKTHLLDAVVKLCESPNIIAIVNYNFDDFLFEELKKIRKCRVIAGQQAHERGFTTKYPKKIFLPIFHIHGYLPKSDRLPIEKESALVFAQDEYFQNMFAPFSWQTTTQLHFLRNYTVLFIGTSLSDANMARMLHHAINTEPTATKFALFSLEDLLSGTQFKIAMKNQQVTPVQRASIKLRTTILDDFDVKVVIPGWKRVDVTCAVERLAKKYE